MKPISLVLITKNEQNNISTILQATKPYVSEQLVVDTGSTDNTISIAKKLGAHTYNFEWLDDFSAARNYAQSLADNDWVLFLDPDWKLDGLDSIKTLDFSIYHSFNARWINHWEGDKVISAQSKKVLYNKKFYTWKGLVHEYLAFTGSNEKVGECEIDMYHDLREHQDKDSMYESLLDKQLSLPLSLIERKRFAMFKAAQLAKYRKWNDIIELVHSCDLSTQDEYTISLLEYYIISLLQSTNKINPQSILSTIEALHDPRKFLILGDYNTKVNSPLSIQHYEKYLTMPHDTFNSINWERYEVYPYIMLGNLYQVKELDKAVSCFSHAASLTRISSKKIQLEGLISQLEN